MEVLIDGTMYETDICDACVDRAGLDEEVNDRIVHPLYQNGEMVGYLGENLHRELRGQNDETRWYLCLGDQGDGETVQKVTFSLK